jgi:3D (Asp-Asp-Asp) domain-containing protein
MKKFLITFCFAGLILFWGNNGAFAATNTYTVTNGDTLYKIAKTYKITVKQLKQWNRLNNDTIHPQQKLKVAIPVKKAKKTVKKTKLSAVKTITVNASAYTVNCKRCSGITATGINLKKNPKLKVISVDPKVIKLGTKVYVEGYGYAIAADKGSSIKGNKIDILVPSKKAALKWGRRNVKVKILK